ncbi:MAG: hypothetical protein ACFFD1_12360 [Candidatus Thorarchaeota archaeon]
MKIIVRDDCKGRIDIILSEKRLPLVLLLFLIGIIIFLFLGFIKLIEDIIFYILLADQPVISVDFLENLFEYLLKLIFFIILLFFIILASIALYQDYCTLDVIYLTFDLNNNFFETYETTYPEESKSAIYKIPFSDIDGLRFCSIYHKRHEYGPYVLLYIRNNHPVCIKRFYTIWSRHNCKKIIRSLQKDDTLRNLNWITLDRPNNYYKPGRQIEYGNFELIMNPYKIE